MIPRSDLGIEGETLGQSEPDQWHDRELADQADDHALRHFDHASEVLDLHLRAHSKHHALHDQESRPLIVFELLKGARIEHPREEGDRDPGGVLKALQGGHRTQSDGEANAARNRRRSPEGGVSRGQAKTNQNGEPRTRRKGRFCEGEAWKKG